MVQFGLVLAALWVVIARCLVRNAQLLPVLSSFLWWRAVARSTALLAVPRHTTGPTILADGDATLYRMLACRELCGYVGSYT